MLAVSEGFVPVAGPLARGISEEARRETSTGKKRASGRGGLAGATMAVKRDVLRMPSSEPMVRRWRRST